MANYEYPFDEFRHRWAHPTRDLPVSREQVYKYVDKLLNLEKKTHPMNGPAADKELDSIMALVYIGKLADQLVGWALDHQSGLILNDTEGFPWPEGDKEAKHAADDHRHEVVGAAYHGADPVLNRRIGASILKRAGILPEVLQSDLAHSLAALDEGEVTPLLDRKKEKSHKGYTLWQKRLNAVQHVHFFVGARECTTKIKALEKVAEAFNCAPSTIRSWEATLPKHFGKIYVENAKTTARLSGQGVYRKRLVLHKDDLDESYIEVHLLVFGEDAMRANARDHQRALRQAAGSDKKST